MAGAVETVVRQHTGYRHIEFPGSAGLRPEILEAIRDALEDAAVDADCRTVVLSSTGPSFCTGLPLDAGTVRQWSRDSAQLCWDLYHKLTTTPVVTVGVVEGPAVGGGVALAAACDLVLVGPGARFRLPEVLLGLVPAMALPIVARRTGAQVATRLALTAHEIDAGEALKCGLADMHAPEPRRALKDLLRRLRSADRQALGLVKAVRTEAFPLSREIGANACDLLRERLAAPSVQARLSRFREEGLLT